MGLISIRVTDGRGVNPRVSALFQIVQARDGIVHTKPSEKNGLFLTFQTKRLDCVSGNLLKVDVVFFAVRNQREQFVTHRPNLSVMAQIAIGYVSVHAKSPTLFLMASSVPEPPADGVAPVSALDWVNQIEELGRLKFRKLFAAFEPTVPDGFPSGGKVDGLAKAVEVHPLISNIERRRLATNLNVIPGISSGSTESDQSAAG